MPGRFALTHTVQLIADWYQVPSSGMHDLQPVSHFSPSDNILIIREEGEERTASLVRWGFIPPMTTTLGKFPIIHEARSETITEKLMFRQTFQRRRCLIPVSSWMETCTIPQTKERHTVDITRKDGKLLTLAGIWETSQIPYQDGYLHSCAVLTIASTSSSSSQNDRMPVLIHPDAWKLWLTRSSVPPGQLQQLMTPCDPELLHFTPITNPTHLDI